MGSFLMIFVFPLLGGCEYVKTLSQSSNFQVLTTFVEPCLMGHPGRRREHFPSSMCQTLLSSHK